MKILNKIIPLLLIAISSSLFGVDLSKIDPRNVIGGFPKPTPTHLVNNSNYERVKKSQSLTKMYRGSSHERRLDAQIRAYRSSAKENERVFGEPYRNNNSSSDKINDLIKRGIVKIITGTDGKQYLVENK